MCDCIKRVDENLKKHNTVLTKLTVVNMITGAGRESLQIATQRLKRGRTKVHTVLPSFCPFCGERVARAKKALANGRAEHDAKYRKAPRAMP